MPNLKRYMTREPYSTTSGDNLARAKSVMASHLVRHLLVIDDGVLLGVISERAITATAAVASVDLATVPVARLLEPAVVAWGEQPIDEVSTMMAEQRSHCVVVRGGHGIAGIFTAVDALRALADIARRACEHTS